MLLLALTLVTGVIDAISLLALGRVFVANMTGNVVVTGFAIAGVPEFSLVTSLVVLATFLLGAALAAVAMGVQNAVARRIAVPDLNTSVVSMSMTGLAADYTHSTRDAVLRRAAAVLSLLVGAVVGAVIVGTLGAAAAFGLILLLLAGVAAAAHTILRRGPAWEG